VKALLLLEELAEQNTRLHLDVSYLQGFWPAVRATFTHIHLKAVKPGSRKQDAN
jgi:hypothetical protein